MKCRGKSGSRSASLFRAALSSRQTATTTTAKTTAEIIPRILTARGDTQEDVVSLPRYLCLEIGFPAEAARDGVCRDEEQTMSESKAHVRKGAITVRRKKGARESFNSDTRERFARERILYQN